MLLGGNWAKGGEENILKPQTALRVVTERDESWSVVPVGMMVGEASPRSSWGKVRGR